MLKFRFMNKDYSYPAIYDMPMPTMFPRVGEYVNINGHDGIVSNIAWLYKEAWSFNIVITVKTGE